VRGGTSTPSVDRRLPERVPAAARPAIRTASKPSAPSEATSLTAARTNRARVPRQPQSAFTVVETNETIRDVALRVYGAADDADVLWRANRDTMPRRDTPLAPGTLLRTPMVR
jgi:hypothetical protein